jgi:hypothetical protein
LEFNGLSKHFSFFGTDKTLLDNREKYLGGRNWVGLVKPAFRYWV